VKSPREVVKSQWRKPGAWAECQVSDDSRELTVRLHGELDVATVPSISEAIESARVDGSSSLVMDLRDLSFMDSSGIALLVRLANRAESVQVRNPSPNVRRVFELTGLARHFGLADSE
jgi:anti-sigma B factor antagonist